MPRAGRAYAAGRNTDEGPGLREAVSELSPYIRRRLLPEWEIVGAAVDRHGVEGAEKFIQEVFWRTYWKGWLERRPGVWGRYRDAVERESETVDAGAFDAAVEGRTGIDCFDFWARELVETGYLHNHARMWFASIWIHTLRLPWSLGAAFFLEHLIDGDPASNTLSWRWVAGLQTVGKTYLAREENIATFTNGRFPRTPGLATRPMELSEESPLEAPLPMPDPLPIGSGAKVGLLLTDEDLSPEPVVTRPASIAGLAPVITSAPKAFALDALADRLAGGEPILSDPAAAVAWAEREGLDTVVTAYAPIGPTADHVARVASALDAVGVKTVFMMRRWDRLCWPHATKGFFAFKKNIPSILSSF